jgi:hypothetical protein
MESPRNNFESEIPDNLEFKDANDEIIKVEPLSDEESADILSVTEIHSDREDESDSNFFKEQGLEPKNILSGTGIKPFAFSRPFMIEDDRIAFIGYGEESNGTFVARSFYLSNSHAMFKYLPSYFKDGLDKIKWFDKGFDEQSISLSYELQRALFHLSSTEELVKPKTKDPMKVFVSTARDLVNYYSGRSTYRKNVSKEADVLFEKEDDFLEDGRISPEKISIPEDRRPDFDNVLGTWLGDNNLYGSIKFTSFLSVDKLLIYTFASDSHGRGWVANVEKVEPTNSMGIHSSRINSPSLLTPAYEYRSQAGDYGNSSMKKENYIDMYKNYLSKVPIVKEFLEKISLQDTQEFATL